MPNNANSHAAGGGVGGTTGDGSLTNSFLMRGASPDTFFRTGVVDGGGPPPPNGNASCSTPRKGHAGDNKGTPYSTQMYDSRGYTAGLLSSAKQSQSRPLNEQPTWSQLSRLQQRIYYKWHRAHQR